MRGMTCRWHAHEIAVRAPVPRLLYARGPERRSFPTTDPPKKPEKKKKEYFSQFEQRLGQLLYMEEQWVPMSSVPCLVGGPDMDLC